MVLSTGFGLLVLATIRLGCAREDCALVLGSDYALFEPLMGDIGDTHQIMAVAPPHSAARPAASAWAVLIDGAAGGVHQCTLRRPGADICLTKHAVAITEKRETVKLSCGYRNIVVAGGRRGLTEIVPAPAHD